MIDYLLMAPLFGSLILAACLVALQRDLLAVAILFGIYSTLMATLFVLLDAADVALTESIIGAGISSVLMIISVAATERMDSRKARHWQAMIAVLITGAALVYGTLHFPQLGDPSASPHQHVAPRYIADSPHEIGIPNIVTSVLASYRGYDTLGEVVVVFCAGVGVLILLGGEINKESSTSSEPNSMQEARLESLLILRVIVKILLPLILMFGLYVQFHGEISPGGGFQAGAIIASAMILFTLMFGLDRARHVVSPSLLRILAAAGLLLYIGVGLLCLTLGGNFLDYNVLAAIPSDGQHLGIWLIELGVCITIASVLLLIFFAFASRTNP